MMLFTVGYNIHTLIRHKFIDMRTHAEKQNIVYVYIAYSSSIKTRKSKVIRKELKSSLYTLAV